MVRELPLFILVIAGGTGSFGTGVSPLIPYLLRERAEALLLPRPELWLLLAGPNAFRGYTSRWQRNYSSTVRAIEHLDRHGLDLPLADGTRLTRGEPAYDKVWLIDDATPLRPEVRQAVSAAPAVTVLRADPAALAEWLQPAAGKALGAHLYLVDPLGNWMMRAPADPEPARLKRDVERLLRASASWDKAGR